MPPKHWLMKAEPDSRVVKGKDVKFSVDDFEAVKTTAWEGVRNAEARNLMKEMRVGDKVLFYHSNCKTPGIAGFAEVSKEAYPDYTAWDQTHPYYDAKTDKEKPKWYMVDVTFVSRASHYVPLAMLRNIASSSEVPDVTSYIGKEGANAIKGMALVSRGRLSVQRVDEEAWDVIQQLAERGGWEDTRPAEGTSKTKAKGKSTGRQKSRGGKVEKDDDDESSAGEDAGADTAVVEEKKPGRRKRKASDTGPQEEERPKRLTRARRQQS